MVNTLYLPELREMLAARDEAGLREFCTALHPARTAEFMEALSPEETWAVLEYAEPALRAELFGFLDDAKQIEIMRLIDRHDAGEVLGNMPPDESVDILKDLEPALSDELLSEVPAEERREIIRLSQYPEDMAGAWMTTEFARVRASATVRQALDDLARQAAELETIYYIYVVDEDDHLLGVVSARQLVQALRSPETRISEIMESEVIAADASEDPESVAHKIARFDLLAIPVVDEEHHIVGIITHDDAIDLVVDEATEDAHRQGAMEPIADNFLDAGFVNVWRKRAVWLSCLFVAELFTFTALASFEHAIASVVALSLFVPLCISTGGNSGSQAATLVTRAIALEQIRVADWFRVLRHELLMGVALGATLGVIGFFRAAMTPQSVLGNADRWLLALVIGQSVAAICLWGTVVGSLLPILFKRLGIDPGIASSPFVATFVDVTGILIYFTIAQTVLLR